LAVTGACLLTGGRLFAQVASTTAGQQSKSSMDQQIDLLRKDLRSQKRQVIAANMKLTDAEAEKFWPTYDQYTAELVKVNNEKYALIKEYAQSYNSLTDEQGDSLSRRWLTLDESIVQLRIKYVPIFRKVLSGRSTALFFQLDRRVQLMIDLQLAQSIPLVEP
jgi:uncharacterized membrane-anchored protein YhcB (DUF1043 family)